MTSKLGRAPAAGTRPPRLAAGACVVAAALAAGGSGCGGAGDASSAASPGPLGSDLRAARHSSAHDFPAARGRTLKQIAAPLRGGPAVGFASSVYTPGRSRIAFAVLSPSDAFVYGETAVYIARRPGERAAGPFPAPADPLVVRPPFRSRQGTSPGHVEAIYAATVPTPRPGPYTVLAVTRHRGGRYAATGRITVQPHSPIPAVGQRPPPISTPTVVSVNGDVAEIDTRVPHDDMHRVDFSSVIGRRPVALLFATPALCRSQVCGPVVDVASQLEAAYGKRIAFIHQEVYVDNDPARGLRPQLRAFHLHSEPWLFTFDREGRVAARLQGAFGLHEFRAALDAALRGTG